MRILFGKLLALALGTLIALILAEVITRVVMPINPGVYKLNAEGQRVNIHDVAPNQQFRQFSAEFDVVTTINKDGYRIPDSPNNPEVVFIGDSFTYGVGLEDKDTFIMQYCVEAGLSCMNLGVPGYGTINAIERLESFIDEKKIKPRKVILVMLAMTGFLGAGNDLYDNIKIVEARNTLKTNDQGNNDDSQETVLRRVSNKVLKYSNLARVVKFYFAPIIKKSLVIKPEENQLQEALKITKTQLEKLHALSSTHQFELDIVLIHPVQDISRGTHTDTFKAVQGISPVKVTPSAHLFEVDPNSFYYPMDGHFNKTGSAKIVELLKSIN